jgi:hypothetical protein
VMIRQQSFIMAAGGQTIPAATLSLGPPPSGFYSSCHSHPLTVAAVGPQKVIHDWLPHPV